MLTMLSLENVGPAHTLEMQPIASRFNLIAGDNGLGKSFLLDVAWWALTRTWHDSPAVPFKTTARISYEFKGESDRKQSAEVKWKSDEQEWSRLKGRPSNPGLVIFARADGSFSAWDPLRNYKLYSSKEGAQLESPPAYQFSPASVLWGLKRPVSTSGIVREQIFCQGLVNDWIRWQEAKLPSFDLLTRLLRDFGPEGMPLEPGLPTFPFPGEQLAIPTIKMPYGQEVPITYAPAGVQRVVKLAYLLTWTLSLHRQEAEQSRRTMSRQITVLIDEPETHLHPRWQRTILTSLQKALEGWHAGEPPEVQFLIATHSPLILASIEPLFDSSKDALWKLDLVDGKVQLARDEWKRRGDVNGWLTSDVFDMVSARSWEAELALNAARELLTSRSTDAGRIQEVDRGLRGTLSETDPFFLRWSQFVERNRESQP